jgi:hypothetical protein
LNNSTCLHAVIPAEAPVSYTGGIQERWGRLDSGLRQNDFKSILAFWIYLTCFRDGILDVL